MADKDFDFKALGEKKLVEYKKEYCKPMIVKKAKAGLIMIDYRLKGKKTPCVLVSFKKPAEAQKAFKQLKKDKEHILKKTGLCKISVATGADGKDEITIDIMKGGLSPEVLKTKGADLFGNHLGMTLKVLGGAEEMDSKQGESEEEEEEEEMMEKSSDVQSEEEQENPQKEANKAKRSAKIGKMNENVAKLDAAVGKVDSGKLTSNIEKYEAALAQLIKEAEADGEIDAEEQASIDELTDKLEALKENVEKQEESGGKAVPKMTPERRTKIKDNMDKLHDHLQAIVKKLGV